MTSRAETLPPLNPERLFFGGMGLVILAVAFAGFAPSFYIRGLVEPYRPALPLTPLIVVHAIAFSMWVLLFITQTALIRGRQIGLHQRLGQIGIVLAAAMVALGVVTATQQAVLGRSPPGLAPLQWLAVPIFDLVAFAALIASGYVWRRDAQTHKRLMLLATVLLLQPAVGRLPLPPDALYGELATLVAWMFTLPLVAWDLFSRGRVHPATAIGVSVLAAEQLIRIAVWQTAAWQTLAAAIVGALS